MWILADILLFGDALEDGRSSVTRGKQTDGQNDDDGCVRARV